MSRKQGGLCGCRRKPKTHAQKWRQNPILIAGFFARSKTQRTSLYYLYGCCLRKTAKSQSVDSICCPRRIARRMRSEGYAAGTASRRETLTHSTTVRLISLYPQIVEPDSSYKSTSDAAAVAIPAVPTTIYSEGRVTIGTRKSSRNGYLQGRGPRESVWKKTCQQPSSVRKFPLRCISQYLLRNV